MISVDSAERRYVRSDSDLPDHDLILELSDRPSSLVCHVRHYVHNDLHVVIAGQLNGGLCPIASATSVAREVAETVVPPGGEFTMIADTPRSPRGGQPRRSGTPVTERRTPDRHRPASAQQPRGLRLPRSTTLSRVDRLMDPGGRTARQWRLRRSSRRATVEPARHLDQAVSGTRRNAACCLSLRLLRHV